jgi:23S rRNA (pseudouridine1915-N3)-methyltransferase
MRVTVVAVGRDRGGVHRDLFNHYVGRLRWPVTLREVEVRGKLAGAKLKREEAKLLLAAIPNGAAVIALDETGKTLSSREFAGCISRIMDDGIAEIALIIGGADGLDASIRERAELTLSLGRVTWPHLLIRGMLTEQLYRAQQIIAGHPYHRD